MNIRNSIKTKIFCVIITPSLILFFVICLDYSYLNSLGRSAELILSKNYKSIQAAQQIRQYIEERQDVVLTSLFLNKKMRQWDITSDQKILKLLRSCKDNITEPGEEQIIESLFDRYERYDYLYDRLLNYMKTDVEMTPDQLKYDFITLGASLKSGLDDLVLTNEKAMEAAERDTKQVAKDALWYSLSLLVFAILFTLVFSYILASKMSRPLTNLAQSLSNIKEGSGNYPRFSITTQDEIGFLSAEFNRLFERLEAYDKLSENKLMAERMKVIRAEEAKARFIADLSHQLKTPMTSLSMSIGILVEKAKGLIGEKYERLLGTAKEDCSRLSSLISELVDIARYDAMPKPTTKEVLRIEGIVRQCLKPLSIQAEEKGVTLEEEFDPTLPTIAIDPLKFPWVITNLVGNAIRYTDRGGRVTLRVKKHRNQCHFQCIDTGIGIEKKYLRKIFDRFTQFSEWENRGTIGLGLAIVKEIVEQHGGDIKVKSKLNEGTTFTFWIPI